MLVAVTSSLQRESSCLDSKKSSSAAKENSKLLEECSFRKKRMVNRQSSLYPQSYEYKRLYIVSEFQMWVGALQRSGGSSLLPESPRRAEALSPSLVPVKGQLRAKWRTDTWDRLKMQLLSVSARRMWRMIVRVSHPLGDMAEIWGVPGSTESCVMNYSMQSRGLSQGLAIQNTT